MKSGRDKTQKSFVSIGMPTYNHGKYIGKAIKSILNQTYKNIELIISNDCSTDETDKICKYYAEKDKRIRYFLQNKNLGDIKNFNFVLKKARYDYFMWAADDDVRTENSLAILIKTIKQSDSYAAIGTEVRYFSRDKKYPILHEGKSFYSFYSDKTDERLCHMLKHQYGTLFYSLFRKAALYIKNKTYIDAYKISFQNELSLFLTVIRKGNWKILPFIGLYKRTDSINYEFARWEKRGGVLKKNNRILVSYFLYPKNLHQYLKSIIATLKTILFIQISPFQKIRICFFYLYLKFRHSTNSILGKK